MIRFWKKPIEFVAIILACSIGPRAYSAVTVSQIGLDTIYDIVIDGVEFKAQNIGGKEFAAAKFKGVDTLAAVRYSLGQPELPVVRLVVDGDVRVEAVPSFTNGFVSNKLPLSPSQVSWSKNSKYPPPVSYDAAAYAAGYKSGVKSFEVVSSGSYRGVPRQVVTLNALRYSPATGEYQLQTRYKVTVHSSPKTETAQPMLALIIGGKFAESDALRRLVEIKKSQGFNIRKIVVGANGISSAQSIRDALRALYAENVNLRYAVIVGDIDDVPAHRSEHISGVTDHFYRAIDTTDYESDINAPDIGVGRISVSNESELNIVVEKIKRYSEGRSLIAKNNAPGDDWMRHPAFITTHDRYQVAEATHNAVIAKHFEPRGYSRVFPDTQGKGGDKLYPISLGATARQIVSHMAQGRFIINFSGHGSYSGWEDVTTADVRSLSDPNALPWVLSNSCITGDFRQEPVFAETWLRHPSGAIVFWGSLDSSYWDEDDILEKAAYEAVFGTGIRDFDSIHQTALGEVWRHYGGENRSKYYRETYVTFGDPSLEVRLDRAKEPEIEGPVAVVMGEQSVQWKLTADGQPVAGAHVTLTRASDGRMTSSRTNSDGEVELNLDVFGPVMEPLTLTVYGADLRGLVREIVMVAPNQPYLGVSELKINGRSEGVHVGELAQLAGAVENLGSVRTSGGRLMIKEITGPAQIVGRETVVDALASRERRSLNPGLSFRVNAEARLDETIRVTFFWETAEGQTAEFVKSWKLIRAGLSVAGIDYGDETVEGVGAQGAVYVTLKNIGTETIRAAELSAAAGLCTSEVKGALRVDELAPGATLRVAMPLMVVTNGSCADGQQGRFAIQGTYASVAGRVSLVAEASYLVGVVLSEVERFEGLDLRIPDGDGSSLIKTIQMTDSGSIKDISLYFKLRHTFVGDLEIRLVSPSGKSISLRDHTGGAADDLEQRFGRGGAPVKELEELAGTEMRGEWQLIIKDTMAQDTGVLEAVELAIRHW